MIKVVTDNNGNRHEICIADDLAFLAPYITAAKRLGIPVWRIREIKGYYVPSDRIERQEAATIRDNEAPNKKLVMTMLTHHQEWTNKKGKFEVLKYNDLDTPGYFEMALDTFAHELTHLVHWDHSPDRYILEKKLQAAFAYVARKRGYKGYA